METKKEYLAQREARGVYGHFKKDCPIEEQTTTGYFRLKMPRLRQRCMPWAMQGQIRTTMSSRTIARRNLVRRNSRNLTADLEIALRRKNCTASSPSVNSGFLGTVLEECSERYTVSLWRKCVQPMVRAIAYKVELPQELSRVHNTFHVSNLKKCYSEASLSCLLVRDSKWMTAFILLKSLWKVMDREGLSETRNSPPLPPRLVPSSSAAVISLEDNAHFNGGKTILHMF
ncbi:hypothetical protein Tco_1164350 [Tanacetum coccineum]